MSLLWWVLLGFMAYWMGLIAIHRAGLLPKGVHASGPIITIHTQRGRAFLERLAGPKRFWRAWGNLGVGVALVIMAGMFIAVVQAGIAALFAPERTEVTQPQNVLVIPGVNEFLPLSAAPEIVAGLLVGLVVHEGGHGLLCRVEDIDIESMGVAMIAIIPIGAFVQPEEHSQVAADRGAKTRMFAAGVMNNFVVTLIAFALLFWLVAAVVAPAPGAAIGGALAGSAADGAGIGAGDRIVAIDGDQIDNASALERYLGESTTGTVAVELADGETVTVERSVLVVGAVPDGPAGLQTEDRIRTIDDEPVSTVAGVRERLADHTVVTVETDESAHRFPAGALIGHVSEEGPFAAAGAPTDEEVTPVITAIDDERIIDRNDAQDVLGATEPGQTIEVEAYLVEAGEPVEPGEEPTTFEVELDEHDRGHGLLGVAIQPGITGVTLNDFGARLYPTETFYATLGGDNDADTLFGLDGFFGKIFTAMLLPIAALMDPNVQQNFAGFTGHVTGFYETTGPLAGFEPVVFLAANVLFWVGWINFNLGIFNCIPAFPLDGGHLLRSATEAIVSRLPVDNRYIATKYVTVSVGLLMLVGLLVMIFGQGLLS